ncbi:AraC family transcriptional regulator [Kribbella sp. NBC_00889]|uniref:helix-turn-helix transcriptional regulator n=1 Tax=Kribbella sp. NBC_00889 TaxID=2975974 RepID=UPI00386F5D45|nr:AraC family transcriptional regulator [Kribbella sp. NBC_00889]
MSLTQPRGLRAGFHADVHDPVSGLVHAGEQWVPEQFLIEPHQHPMWEIYLQLHGVTRWVADDASYLLQPGHLFAVPPGLVHHLAGRSGNHHFYFAAIDLDPVVRRQPALTLGWPTTVVHREAGEVAHAFAQLVRELTTRYEYNDTGLALAVDHLVLSVARAMAPTAAPQLAMHPAVRTVKRLLEQEFHEHWTLRRLADRVGLAPSYLAELFADHLGQPPHRYLNERRIDRARQLLESSDLTITALALSLGFSSSQHFARVFRQLTNTTPSAYRSARE